MKRTVLLTRSVVVLLSLAAFAVPVCSLDAQSLWRDEVDALRFATAPLKEVLASFGRPGWNGPLYFLLLRGWIVLTGTSEYAMRFSSLVFGVLCVPLVYVLGRRLLGRRVGILAALLMAVSPYLAWYGQEVKMYTMVTAFVLLAIYALPSSIEGRGRVWWAVLVAATSLVFYLHILAAFLVLVHALLVLTWWPRVRRRWLAVLGSLACLIIPYLPLAVWQAPRAFEARETGFARHSLGEMVQSLLDGWSTGIFGAYGWGWPWTVVLLVLLAVCGPVALLVRVLVRTWRNEPGETSAAKGWREHAALLCWLASPLLSVWLISLWQPLFTDRYLIWTAPAFYLLVAVGWSVLWRGGVWARRVAALSITLVLVFDGINLWRQATVSIKSDVRGAVAYVIGYRAPEGPESADPLQPDGARLLGFRQYLPLVQRGSAGIEGLIVFQIPYIRHAFDYYSPVQGYEWADGLYTNHRHPDGSYVMSEAEAGRRMREMMQGHHVIWLVVTEEWMWDERGLVHAWLEENAQLESEAHFAHVDVCRYIR